METQDIIKIAQMATRINAANAAKNDPIARQLQADVEHLERELAARDARIAELEAALKAKRARKAAAND